MRLLQVVSDNDRRGAQVFATGLGHQLAVRGHEVRTVALGPGSGRSRLGHRVLGSGRLDPRQTIRLRSAIRAAEVTVAHGGSTLLACALASTGQRTPFVYRQVSDPVAWTSTRLRRLRTGAALRRARMVVALSEHNRRQLEDHQGLPPTVLRVVPNGAPLEEFPIVDPRERPAARRRLGLAERPTVAFLGALSWEKAPTTAVEAIARIPGVQLLIAGQGPQRAAVEDRARALLSGRARVLEPVADPRRLYAASDVVLLTSRTEAMPGTLIEAGLCGLPVVATRVGAVPEIVLDGETGLLASADDVAGIAAAVDRIIGDPALTASLGRRARAHCEARFAMGVVATGWESVLREALAPGPVGGR